MGEKLWVHIRIGIYHFKIGKRTLKLSRNEYHIGYPSGRFEVYQIFGWYL